MMIAAFAAILICGVCMEGLVDYSFLVELVNSSFYIEIGAFDVTYSNEYISDVISECIIVRYGPHLYERMVGMEIFKYNTFELKKEKLLSTLERIYSSNKINPECLMIKYLDNLDGQEDKIKRLELGYPFEALSFYLNDNIFVKIDKFTRVGGATIGLGKRIELKDRDLFNQKTLKKDSWLIDLDSDNNFLFKFKDLSFSELIKEDIPSVTKRMLIDNIDNFFGGPG